MTENSSSGSIIQKRSVNEDASSPYYLVSGDNPSVVLVNPQLSGSNFHSWSRSMRIALGAKNKLQLINNTVPVPKETDSDFAAWQRCDLMVQSWILNSCTKEVAQCILYAESAAEMWRILDERFSQAKFRERVDRKKDKIPLGVLKVIEELLSTLLFWEATCGVFMMTCNQLDWLTLLPWGEYSDVNLDKFHAKKVIEENHYILADFKESILETILAAGSSQSDYILCLCGPPEMGKASIGLSIALALNRKFYQFPAGGLSEAKIRLGESDYSDDPVAAMYKLLDCRQNENFEDCYLRAPIDLSKVLFVCTATDVEKIPSRLLDLMEVLPFNEDYAKKETQEGGMMQFPEAYEETMLYC